jgi:GAF domain-containing protein
VCGFSTRPFPRQQFEWNTDDDARLLQLFADPAAMALATVSLIETKVDSEKRLRLLLEAISLVVQGGHPREGLAKLAEMVTTRLGVAFCRILLMDELGDSLGFAAGFLNRIPVDSTNWNSDTAQPVDLTEWSGVKEILEKGLPRILRWESERARPLLETITKRLAMQQAIRFLLLVPLNDGKSVVGLFLVGNDEDRAFTADQSKLVAAIGRQTTTLIERLRNFEFTEREKDDLIRLDETLRNLVPERNLAQLSEEISRLGAELVGWTDGRLYAYHHELNVIEFQAAHPPLPDLTNTVLTVSDSLIGDAARTGEIEARSDYEGFTKAIAVPLKRLGQVERVLFVGDRTSRRFWLRSEKRLLERFGRRASFVLATAELLKREKGEISPVEMFNEVSRFIRSTQDLDEIIHVVLTAVTANFGLRFNSAALLMVDDGGKTLVNRLAIGHLDTTKARDDWSTITGKGVDDFAEYITLLRAGMLHTTPLGASMKGVRLPIDPKAGDPFARTLRHPECLTLDPSSEKLPDEFQRAYRPVTPIVLAPLVVRGETTGLVIADNRITGETITLAAKDSLMTLAGTLAAAIDNLRLHEQTRQEADTNAERAHYLTRQEKAMQAMSSSITSKQVLQSITKQASELFQCNVCVVWSYDKGSERFLPDQMETAGLSRGKLNKMRAQESPFGPSFKGLNNGYMSLEDSSLGDMPVLQKTRDFAKAIGVRSFQAVQLEVGREIVGVLFVSYRHSRRLSDNDKRRLRSFGTYAALAIKKARLLEQVVRIWEAASVVARVSTIGGVDDVLNSVVEETQNALGCDVVTAYPCNPTTGVLDRAPMVSSSAWYPEKIGQVMHVLPGSLVFKMLQLTEPYIDEDVKKSAFFNGSRFASEEDVSACMVIPLVSSRRKVGILCVNYRSPHQFTSDERTTIQLFADQATVSIQDAQDLQELVALSKDLLETPSVKETQDLAVAKAKMLLKADFAQLVLPGTDRSQLVFAATAGWPDEILGTILPRGTQSHAGFTILSGAPVPVEDFSKERRFYAPLVQSHNIQSGLSVPILRGESVIGALLVDYTQPRHFTNSDIALMQLIAHQTAIAIQSAERFQALRRQAANLRALLDSAKAITHGSLHSSRTQILDTIIEQAVLCVSDGRRIAGVFGIIQLYNAETKALRHESIAWSEAGPNGRFKVGDSHIIDGPLRSGPVGVTGRTLLARTPQLVNDVSMDPDYLLFDAKTASEICVPLLEGDEAIGVLNLESNNKNAFDEEDVSTLEALAELAVIVIQNVRQYEELKLTKGLVGARTALAWMGMAANHWRHTVTTKAVTITGRAQLIQKECSLDAIQAHVNVIIAAAEMIYQKPITPPLSSEEGVAEVAVNALVQERLRPMQRREPFDGVIIRFETELSTPESGVVRCSPEWLRRALEIVIDNAVEAALAVDQSRREIMVTTRCGNGLVEIEVTDRGLGIAEDIAGQIFINQVKKRQMGRGLGMGLLMAQAIVQTYGGQITLRATGPGGTTMVIALPIYP